MLNKKKHKTIRSKTTTDAKNPPHSETFQDPPYPLPYFSFSPTQLPNLI